MTEHRGNKDAQSEKPSPKKKIGAMDIILIIVGISLLAFTVEMIVIFKTYGMVPDTLVTCVFATLGGECGIMGWIKTTKDRNKERKWEKEDKAQEKLDAQEAAETQPRNDL